MLCYVMLFRLVLIGWRDHRQYTMRSRIRDHRHCDYLCMVSESDQPFIWIVLDLYRSASMMEYLYRLACSWLVADQPMQQQISRTDQPGDQPSAESDQPFTPHFQISSADQLSSADSTYPRKQVFRVIHTLALYRPQSEYTLIYTNLGWWKSFTITT